MIGQMHAKNMLSLKPASDVYPDTNHQIMTLTVPVGIYLQIMTADSVLHNLISKFDDPSRIIISNLTKIYEPNPEQWEFPNAKFTGHNDHRPGEGNWEDLFRDSITTTERMCDGIFAAALCDRIRSAHVSSPNYEEKIKTFLMDWGKDKMKDEYNEEWWFSYATQYLKDCQSYPTVINTIAKDLKDHVFKDNSEKGAFYQSLLEDMDTLTEECHQKMKDIQEASQYLFPQMSLCTFTITFNKFSTALEQAYRFRDQIKDDEPITPNPIEDDFIREFIGIITGEVPMR